MLGMHEFSHKSIIPRRPSAAWGLLLMLVTALSRKRRKALDRVPITVRMLVTAVSLGKWDSAKVENSRLRRTIGKAMSGYGIG